MPIVAVVALGAGAGETGLLQVAATLPFVILAFPIGLLVDRTSRARLMAGAEGVRAVSLLLILGLALGGQLSLGWLALLGFLGACGTAVYSVAAPSLIPALVPPGGLAAANARIELARTAAFTGGPALGGILVGSVGGSAAFGLAAGASLAAALLLVAIEEPGRTAPPARQIWREVSEGAAFVWRHALLRPIFATQIVFNASFFIVQAVFVPYAVAHLGLSPSGIGLTLAGFGGAMVVGSLLAPVLIERLPFGVVIGCGPVSATLAAVVLALTVLVPSPALSAVAWFLFGVGPILWTISTTTLRQAVTPPALLGRVTAISIVTWGARPIGAGIGAYVGTHYSEGACLVVAAFGFFVQMAMVLASPLVRLRERPPMVDDLP